MGAQYQLVHSGQLYGCMKMTRKFVQATQFSNVVYLQTARRYLFRLLSRWLYSKLISSLKLLSKLKNHALIYLTGAPQHKETMEFSETNSYFHSLTYKKNIFSSSSYIPVDRFSLRICWQTEKLWIQHQNILCLLEIKARLLFFLLA